MPKIPGFPEKPHYNSVKAYLSELAKDIAEMVVDPVKMERFGKQLETYARFWKKWKIAEDADKNRSWTPEMGRPEYIFNVFSRSYNMYEKDIEKETKQLAGSYALCALIHDSQLPQLPKINTDIIPVEAVEETLSAPRNTLEGRLIGNWNSGPDVGEIYVIEEFFNRVNIDLKEFCKSEENKSTQASIERQIQQANELSDIKFLELTAKKFEERAKKVLSKDETWHDLERSLKGWFDSAISRLEKLGFKEKTSLLKYNYKNLMHYARGSNINSFRGFPDSEIKQLASKQASDLAAKFNDFAQNIKDNLAPEKPDEVKKPSYSSTKSVTELITQGESHTLEFKETFEYDIRQNQQNKILNKGSLKTIAAFLNTDGGTLLIGISDSGEVRGIQKDLKYAKGHDRDGFEQKLRHLINDRFDPSPLGSVQIMFEDLQESIVCNVAVEQNLEPIAFDDDFYIRDGNGTRKLKGRAITDWIQQRKKSKISAESKKESTETKLDSEIPIRELLIMNILAAKKEQSEEEILDYLKENEMSNLDCHAAISSLTGKGFIRQTNTSPVSYNICPRGYQWAMRNKNLFDQLNAEALSDEAKKMLLKAAQVDGVIMKAHNMRERCIQINSENIISSQDPRTVAKWEGALDELEENDFIKDKGYKGEVFGVTNKGYKYADKIK